MSAYNMAFEYGMKLRASNISESQVTDRCARGFEPGPAFVPAALEGWKFMDHTILARDILEGNA